AASRSTAQPQPLPVVVAPVVERNLPTTISVVGTVRPLRRTLVAAEAAGLVEQLSVRQGDRVEAGQVLCQLDDSLLRLQHRQAVAELAGLQERIGELEALFERWRYEKARIDRLYEQRVASEKEFRDITTEYQTVARRLAQARHSLQAGQARVAYLAKQLEKTTIRVPFSGHVVSLKTEVGQWLAPGSAVLELIDIAKVLVRVDVPASAVGFCGCGDPCQVTIDAVGRQFVGTIRHIIPQADQAARTVPVEIELDNQDGRLVAGMFARACVPAGPTVKRLLVPRDALSQQGPMRLVYLVQQSSQVSLATAVPVKVSGEYGAAVAVDSPMLSAGQKVIVRGNEQLLLTGPGPKRVQVVGMASANLSQPPGPVGQASSQPSSLPASSGP
ncbi:MAG: efflux RND transporter periplasmic adaptor subunit, partial [Phycisphaerae bacterium]